MFFALDLIKLVGSVLLWVLALGLFGVINSHWCGLWRRGDSSTRLMDSIKSSRIIFPGGYKAPAGLIALFGLVAGVVPGLLAKMPETKSEPNPETKSEKDLAESFQPEAFLEV
jgi:hypothetical protein